MYIYICIYVYIDTMCVYTYYTRHIENDREIDTQRNRYVRYVCTDAWTPFIRCLDLNFCAPHSSQSNASKKLCCYGQKTPEKWCTIRNRMKPPKSSLSTFGEKRQSLLIDHYCCIISPIQLAQKRVGPFPTNHRPCVFHSHLEIAKSSNMTSEASTTNDSHFDPEIKPTILWEYCQRIELNNIHHYISNVGNLRGYITDNIDMGLVPLKMRWGTARRTKGSENMLYSFKCIQMSFKCQFGGVPNLWTDPNSWILLGYQFESVEMSFTLYTWVGLWNRLPSPPSSAKSSEGFHQGNGDTDGDWTHASSMTPFPIDQSLS